MLLLCSCFFVAILLMSPLGVMAMPRLLENDGAKAEFDYQKFRTDTLRDEHLAAPPLTFIEQLGRMELVQSIRQFMQRIGLGAGENSEKTNQRIERRSPSMKSVQEQHREIFAKRRYSDNPIMSANVRSPTIRRTSSGKEPQISSSIDARPQTITKEQHRNEQQPTATAQLNGIAQFQEAIGKEWKHALFGRGGLLTEIFNFVNDKRKDGLAKQQQQQATPNLNDKASTEFGKIVDALLRKAKSGNFDEEPLPEIPFIGICNRLSCADIYKALDQFRKSEFFSNFQTAISLLQDPKGLDMVGELLANPDLIENFSGPESIGDLFGSSTKKAQKTGTGHVEIGENTDAENIGVDFSTLIDGPNNHSNNIQLPQIATSIDSGGGPDYYSFVEQKVGNAEKLNKTRKDNVDISKKPITNGKNLQTTKTSIDLNRALPEIAESIDRVPEEEDEDFPGGDMLVFEKNEWLPSASANGTKKFLLTPIVGAEDRKKVAQSLETVKQQQRTKSKTTEQQRRTTTTTKSNKIVAKTTSTTAIVTTTTRRNFRRDDDYYSMYYDGESG